MQFEFNNYVVETRNQTVWLKEERIFVSKLDRNGKPEKYAHKHLTKEIILFDKLYFLEQYDETYYKVIDNIFDFIDYIEILKSFGYRQLVKDKIYNFKNFSAELYEENKKVSLAITFTGFNTTFYDKITCSLLVSKFQKILSRCEPWQE